MRWIARALSACVISLAATTALAQAGGQSENPVSTLHVTSRLVVLDVRVVDTKGKFVSGLKPEDFLILEDKTPQHIRNFEGPASHTMPSTGEMLVNSTADLAKIGSAPVNVLVVDELNTAFGDSARAQQAVKKFLEAQPEILPVPTLFLAVGARKVSVLHDFTQSRAELLASMKGHITDIDARALNNELAGGSTSAPDGFAKTLGALSQVASSVRGIPGHKNVIWIGEGFDNAYDLTSASDSDAQIIADAVKLVTSRMLDARMSLSTIDAIGVDALAPEENVDAEATSGSGPSSVTDFTQDVSFDGLALSTGGTVVHGRNDLEKLVSEDAGDAGEYYTLTYAPTGASDAAQEYRNIRVVMKNPALHAITRTEYYPGGNVEVPVTPSVPKTQTRELKFDLLSAGSSRMVYTGLHVGAAPVDGGYNVQVEASDLNWNDQGDGTRLAEVSMVGVAFDKKDKVLVQQAKEFKERIKDTDNIHGTRVGFKLDIATPPGTVRVRFVVRDAATGTIGSVDSKK